MNIKKQWVKPVMVTEQFSAYQYVAICALPAQYLYVDGTEEYTYHDLIGVEHTAYRVGSDGVFQNSRHANSFFEALWNLIRTLFTGRVYTTNGEYSGIHTIDNPTVKGTPFSFTGMTQYPVYGSTSQLQNGTEYSGGDLRGRLKITPNEDIYIQGNMS